MSTKEKETKPADLLLEMERCWPLAQHYWSRFLLLHPPRIDNDAQSVAQIHLNTRQILLNQRQISELNLEDCIEGLLAHEVGHHVKYPGTMVVEARMRMLEKSIIPLDGYSLTNVFQDLMINQFLGEEEHIRFQLIKVYRAFAQEGSLHGEVRWKKDPAFLFYLSMYESLWNLKPGTLMGTPEREFASAFYGYRAESQLVVHELFHMEPNVYTQFLYFVSVMTRYLKPMLDEKLEQWKACQCGSDQPSTDDWADALTLTDAERQAIERAAKSGWFAEDQLDRLRKLNELEERIASLPGFGTDQAHRVPEIMASHYRQLAEKHLVQPPPLPRMGEAVVPTTLVDWDFSEPVRDIDWLATLSLRGSLLGAVQPLKRIPMAEIEGFDVRLWQPRLEIYLDVSGSMPNPILQLNAMTLAAQILTLGTTRAGGSVRAALYSSQPTLYWNWCRSDVEMSQFLMHYIGGGTDFPFVLLRRSCEECGPDQPIRVVITDGDFDQNYLAANENADILLDAIRRSPHFILLLHRPAPERVKVYREKGATVVEVAELQDFPKLSTELAFGLFPSTSQLP